MNPARKKIWKAWLPAILWLIIIAIESTELLSSANESRILYPLLTLIFGHIDLDKFYYWNAIGRKVGHFVGYYVLSYLLFRAWSATVKVASDPHWSIQWARLAFFMSALVASMDEFHQSFLASRTGTYHDVLLDSFAALVAQLVIYFWRRSRRKSVIQPAV